MSGTRLRSQKAQATEKAAEPALLIVAHGERGGAGNDRLVYEIAEQLRHGGSYPTVHGCFVSKEPSLKSVVDGLSAGPVTIYPLFMSDGYFVKQAIPRSIGDPRQVRMLPPTGLNSKLPRLAATVALQAAKAAGWTPGACHLLLVAHGSRHDSASRDATRIVAASIEAMAEFSSVRVSFLEERPFVHDELANISGPVLVAGLFIGQGMHGGEDVPRAVNESLRNDVVMLPPMTRWPGLVELICKDVSKSSAVRPISSILDKSSGTPS